MLVPKKKQPDTVKPEGVVVAEPTDVPESSASSEPVVMNYTMEEVKAHADASSCWTAINGNVYDLTAAIDLHKGGRENMLKLCGIDGTTAFETKHGGQEKPTNWLKTLQIGTLN